MPELSEPGKKLIEKYKDWQKAQNTEQSVSTIHVDEVASAVAAFYERIRTMVDWTEEHLMRRAAIIRKLKRRFLDFELNNFSEISGSGESLVFELIRGGHFPNDKIEELKIDKVQNIINKYVFILKTSPENKNGKAGLQFYNWLIEVCSCEIEEALAPATKEMALMDYMFGLMKEKIKVNEAVFEAGLLKKEDTDIQVYIAVQRALFKLDKPIISYNLIKYKCPQWGASDRDSLLENGQNIFKLWKKIEQDLARPIAKKFYRICEKYDTPYLLLGDILALKNPQTVENEIKNPSALEGLIREVYKKRAKDLKTKIWRAAVYSTVSIFLTKIFTLIILDVLLARVITGHFNAITLIFDVLIPTTLMFALVSTAKPPSKQNLNMVIMETVKIIYDKGQEGVYEIKMHKKRRAATRIIISLAYSLSSIASFGLIYLIFRIFEFPATSIAINIIFIALILFAGNAVRKRAEELTIEDSREGIGDFISDIFFLPVAGMGQWLSNKWKKYNAVAAFFNAMIDMPFSVFVEFIERWRYFLKEKKEEMH